MRYAEAFGEEVLRQVDKALEKRGRANILVAGKTGVGKSTLVNAVFQGRLAATGQGKPVTMHFKEISKKGIPIHIVDTRGLEIESGGSLCSELLDFVKTRNKSEDANEHIHAAWLCILEASRRIEDAESELAQKLSDFMPVVNVITQAKNDQGFKAIVEKEISAASNTVRVRALGEELDDGHVLKPMGLLDLVELTSEVIPEGQENAFVAAQKVSLGKKIKRAHKVVATFAATAAGIGATPIPFSDAALLAPTQVGMLAGISAVFGLKFDKAFLGTLISGAISGIGGTIAGRAIVVNMMKMIPGVNVAGSAIAGTTAAILTTTFGEAYIGALKVLVAEKGVENIDPKELAEIFKKKVKGKRK